MNKIKKFLKFIATAWEEYSKDEHNRYENGYYVTTEPEPRKRVDVLIDEIMGELEIL